MAEHYKQPCPLCGSPAQYCLADYRKKRQYTCPECTDFQITDTAERKLEGAPLAWRRSISEKVKSIGPEWVLDIMVPSGQKKEGEGYQSLSCEAIPRESLPPCH